ncbi:MAG TPA: J domain-containing protein [Acidimicrobiales bacterium]|nr:J domain-containing protein [Acidimicrobiales bacterium]
MDLADARRVLGVAAGDDWSVVRAAYRERVRVAHPDVTGGTGSSRTVELNAAYRTLSIARREGRLHDEIPSSASPRPAGRGGAPPVVPRDERPAPSGPPPDVRILGPDTLVLSSPPDETFRRLVEATHGLGEISYLDRSSAIFEAVLHLDDGTPASFVVSLQWRAHDASCEAFCTLEALDRAEHLDVSGVLAQLLPHIPADRGT